MSASAQPVAEAPECGAGADIESVVMQSYAAVLDCPVTSADEDFFLLGGNSLLAMRLLAQLSKQLSVKVSVGDILTFCTPRSLAAHIASVKQQEVSFAGRIPLLPERDAYPLSSSQQRMWFLQRLHEDGRVYLIPFAARLFAPVDRTVLQQALLLVEERHSALRLRVSADTAEQRFVASGSLQLEYHELPDAEACVQAARVVLPMAFGFDNPLVRVALYQSPEGTSVLAFCFHHIIFDGWSSEVFLRDLNRAYEAVMNGNTPAWEPLDIDYVSYAEWGAEQESADFAAMRQDLLPLPERLPLPLDMPRPAVQDYAGGVHVFALRPEQVQGLRRYVAEQGCTLFPALLALVKVFLFRHTGQPDIVIGCTAANREHDQVQNMIGLFVNTLGVRTMLDAQRDFTTLVHQEQAVLQRALAAQSYPFEKVIDVLGVERNLSRNPLFDVFVALEDASWAVYDREPLRMEAVSIPHNTSKFDLSLYFRETAPDCFEVHLEYCTEMFREDTIRAMGERLSVLLDDVLQRPAAPLHALAVMPERENALIAAFNATDEPFDNERDVDSCFREQVAQTPQAMAMRDHTGQALSYAQMDARVSALAAYLAAQGLGRGQYAGICFDRSVEMMLGIFAVMRLGAIYVPLSAALPQARLQSMFEDLGGCTVITAAHLADRFEGCGQQVLVPDMASLPAAQCAPQDISPDSVAYTLFTSGSTGRPKGVQIEHHSLRNRLLWMQSRFPIGQGDVILQKTTISFDVSIWELFWWSWCGAELALLEPEGEKNPAKIVAAVAANRVTVLHFVPSMLRVFLDYLESNPKEVGRLASLRYAFTSGEALPADLATRWNALLQAELHNLYGPTEAAIDVTWYPCTGSIVRSVPIGRPVSNTRLYVLDAQRRPVPPGVTGELYISGIQVARGYVNRPDLTERSFLPDPFFPGSRMYRTGDLGRWLADGNIEYLGRNDDQVKIRGFRIELGEVEAALNRCSGVSQAVVRVCRVGGYDALEAFVLPHAGATLTLGQLRTELAAMLPEYMQPALFRLADAILLSSSGKADRKAMQGRLLQSPADFAQADESPLHDAIRSLWHRVMPEVAVADPELGFFEAGGNSLLLVQLHALLEEHWPGVFSLAGLFADSSISKQAERIEASRTEQDRVEQTRVRQVAPATTLADRNAPVAIIGMAVRMGDYEDAERFWEDLAGGADKNIPLPEKRQREVRQIFEAVGYAFDAAKLREAAYLADISSFDHRRFGLSPGDASMLDPKQRLFLEVAAQALDDAGYGGAALENRNVGTFVGASPYRLFQDAVTRAFPDQSEQIYLLNVPSNVVARLSYLKNWSGPAATVDTACSSVLKAVHDACQSLRSGESCVALAGGVHTIDLPVKSDTAFTIEAASGRTRTFDAAADGVGAGEGAAVFVLKLLDAAVRDNDAIHAVIAGSAVNQDGRSSSMAAPNPHAQAEVITLAARNAGVPLSAMSFFEAHGTATVLGDPVEVEGLTTAFARAGVRPSPKALIGSVKGNIGHLDAAAGAAGLAKAVLALRKGFVPPQPHFTSPNPHIDFDTAPVRVARSLEPLAPYGRPWHCGVSSFGLSGVNTHIVLREYEEHGEHETHAPQPENTGMWYCVPLSAGSEAGLRAYCRTLRDTLVRNGQVSLPAVAATLVTGREHLDVRTAFVVDSIAALVEQLGGDIPPVHCGRERQAGMQAVAAFAGQAAAEAFAQAYLQGATPLWPDDVPLHRVHLPATPFDRTSLWPRFADTVLSAPVETPDGMAYSVAIDRADFWPVAEHRLQGIPTLVGMSMAELAGKALGFGSFVMEGLRWKRPVTHEEGSRATLFVKPQGAGFALSLRHGKNGEWDTAVSATAYSSTAPASVLDIAALRNSMREQAPEGGAAPVTIGRRWHCREELLVSEDGTALLARLSLPEEFRHDLHTYKWHPAMMDIAASLALHGAPGFIPAQCGQMRLHKPLPAVVCAYVRITERLSGMITADCTITDSAGVVLVEMRGLVFMTPHMPLHVPLHMPMHTPMQTSGEVLGETSVEMPAAAAQSRPRPEPELYELGWQIVRPEPVFPPAPGRLLVLDAIGCAAAGIDGDKAVARYGALRDSLVAAADLVQAFPQEREAQQALAATIVHDGVDRIACLLPDDACAWNFGSLMREVARAGLRRPVHITAVGNGALAPCPDWPDSKGFTDDPERKCAAGVHPATPEHALA
ncbi:MAG: amino acid adenylation domain-containing protein, partial [Halodesulfovibrio sp.]